MPDVIKNKYLVESESSVFIGEPSEAVLMLGEDSFASDEQSEGGAFDIAAIQERVLSQVKEEASHLLDEAVEEAKRLQSLAVEQGYSDGRQAKESEISQCIEKVHKLMDQLEDSFEEFLHKYESQLSELSLAIAQKLIAKRLERNDLELSELVKQAMSTVKKAEWIRVEISSQMPELIEYLEEEIKRLGQENRAEVVSANLSSTSCRIQTPDGVVDASLDIQIENLRQRFSEANAL